MEIYSGTFIDDAGLANYWRLEGDFTPTIGTFDGTSTNVTYSSANGKYGQGAGFNGISSKINLAAGTDAWAWSGTQHNSFTFWLNPTNVSHEGRIINKYNYGVNNYFYIELYGNRIKYYREWPPTYPAVTSNTDLSAGSWVFIATTYNGTQMSIYRNGILDCTPVASGSQTYGGSFPESIVGCSQSGGVDQLFFNGKIDDVSSWNRVLTDAEILLLYQESGGGAGGGLDLTSRNW